MMNTTWDPNAQSGMALSNGNLTATVYSPPPPGADGMSVRSSTSRTAGKAYVEFAIGQVSPGGLTHIGIANSSWDYSNPETLGLDGNSFGYQSDGVIVVAGTGMGSADSFGAGDVVQLCVDFDAKLFWVAKNNDANWNGVHANPAAGTGGTGFYTIAASCFFVAFCSANGGDSATANFGAGSFAYTPPSGFSGWNSETTQTIWDQNAEDGMTLSNSNLTATVTAPAAGGMAVRSLTFWNAGKAYIEFTMGQVSANGLTRIGIGNSWWNYTRSETLGFDGNSFEYESDGYIFIAASNMAQADSFGAGDTVRLCVDFGARLFWVTKNNDGNWNGVSGDPAAGTGGIDFSAIPGPWFAGYCGATAGDSVTVNFGASAFSYTPPSGFSAWGGGFGGGFTPRPAALADYPNWKQYANWTFGSNPTNNIQSLEDMSYHKWVHAHDSYNNSHEVEAFNQVMDERNHNVQFKPNYCYFVAIWTGGTIETVKTYGKHKPKGNVTSMQVELPLDEAFPSLANGDPVLSSVAYVEGRFKCPNVRGSWPAFWTIGHWMNCGNAGCTGDDTAWGPEIDIMEIELPTNTTYPSASSDVQVFDATLHASNNASNSCFENDAPPANIPPGGANHSVSGVTYYGDKKHGAGVWNLGYLHMDHVIDPSDGYHRFGCLIEPNQTISIWIDNQQMGHFDATQYCSDHTSKYPTTPVAIQLLIDLALNGDAEPIKFHDKNYYGLLNSYRLEIKNVQIWGPPA